MSGFEGHGTHDRIGQLVLRICLTVGVFAAVLVGCQDGADTDAPAGDTTAAESTTATPASAADPIKHGEYLVVIGGCNDCHTPLAMTANGPEPDMSKQLSGSPAGATLPPMDMTMPYLFAASGTAFRGPWGVSYARNLTPDSATGIGTWTEATFIETIRSGQHMGGGRPIMPPMPWFNYAKMTDDDLKAVFAYLRTVPAISNQVPEYEPPTGAAPGAPAPADTAKPM